MIGIKRGHVDKEAVRGLSEENGLIALQIRDHCPMVVTGVSEREKWIFELCGYLFAEIKEEEKALDVQ